MRLAVVAVAFLMCTAASRCLMGAVAPVSPAVAGGPELIGSVVDEKGAPIAAATAYVYTAGVKKGTSPYCPSCYADCGKHVRTVADGRFKIPSLSPELRFTMLFVAEGYKPGFVHKVDPSAGPIVAKLTKLPARLDPARALKGRVLDASGKPVVGASVEPFGCKTPESRWWGAMEGVDPLGITNSSGEFLITVDKPTTAIDLKVSARGLAPKLWALLPLGEKSHDLILGTGATVSGRLMTKDGTPLANVSVGLIQKDRSCERYTGELSIGTDADGKFTFVNVAPAGEWIVYGTMASLGDRGAVASEVVQVGGDDSVNDAGEFRIGPSHTVSGQVRLSDGKPVPTGTRLLLSRDAAWDSQIVTLDEQGRFAVRGVPSELVSISVSLKGYHLSRRNVSLDTLNLGSIEGLVDGDIADLCVLLEPGEAVPDPSDRNRATDEWEQNRKRRIQGVPATAAAAVKAR